METFTWLLELKLDGVNWTDCSADVSLGDGAIEVTGGFQSTSLVDLLANPGSLSWVFDNSAANSAHLAGYYTPGHTNCRSGFAKNVRARYSEYYNSVRIYQGEYWLQKPIPSPGVFGEAVTRCRAVDWLGLMTGVNLPIILIQTNQRADQLLTTLLAATTTQPAGTDYDTGVSTFYKAFDTELCEKDTVYSVLGKISRSEYGRIFLLPSTGGGGVLTFECRGADAAKTTPLGTISNVMEDVEILDNADQIYDRVQVTVYPIEPEVSSFIVAFQHPHLSLAAYEERKFIIYFSEGISGTGGRISVEMVYELGYGNTYFFGTVNDDYSDDLHANLLFTGSVVGANCVLLDITNSGAVAGYFNWFGHKGTRYNRSTPWSRELGTGGLRVLTVDMAYESDQAMAESLAATLQPLASSNTRRSCRVGFHANKSAALMVAAQTGLISTRWTISETQTALNSDFFIAGVKRTIGPGNRLDVEWLMRPV
jgi:hypothetical protein